MPRKPSSPTVLRDSSTAKTEPGPLPAVAIPAVADYVTRQRIIDILMAQQAETRARVHDAAMTEFRAQAKRSDRLVKALRVVGPGGTALVVALKRKPASRVTAAGAARLRAAGAPLTSKPGTLRINPGYLTDEKLLVTLQKFVAKHDDLGIFPEDFFGTTEPVHEVDDGDLIRVLRAGADADGDLFDAVGELTLGKLDAAGPLDHEAVFDSARMALADDPFTKAA